MVRIALGSRIGAVRLAPAAILNRQQSLNHFGSLKRLPYVRRSERLQTRSAADNTSPETYPGMYGSWSVTQQDLIEVWTYRVCISIVAGTFATGTALSLFLPDVAATEVGSGLAGLGAAALGLSLVLIHIYVTPLKRMLQIFWAGGILGGIYLLFNTGVASLPSYVADNHSAVWFIGPSFAALTGISFKEGVCYGKAEAFSLSILIPALLLGHLSGLGDLGNGAIDKILAVVVTGLLLVFAARKYTQPVKDDIGDGSVFNFMRLSPEEQAAVVAKLESGGGRSGGGGSGFDD